MAQCKLGFFRAFIEHPLHRRAYSLIRPVDTANPTARATLPLEELFASPLYAAVPGFKMLCIFNPADKFVPRERRNIFP